MLNKIKLVKEDIGEIFYRHGKLCSSHPLRVLSLAFTCINILCGLAIYSLVYKPIPFHRFWEVAPQHHPNFPLDREHQLIKVAQIKIQTNLGEKQDVLNHPTLKFLQLLIDKMNRELPIQIEDKEYSYKDVCFVPKGYSNCFNFNAMMFWNQSLIHLDQDLDLIRTTRQWVIKNEFELNLPIWAVFDDILFDDKYMIGAKSLILTLFFKKHEQIESYKVWHNIWTRLKQGQIQKIIENIPELILKDIQIEEGDVKLNYFQFAPNLMYTSAENMLMITGYIVVVLYLFFSISKFKMVKSKFWLGFAALFLLNVSLLMSLGACFLFGLKLSLLPYEVLPFLIIAIGAENLLRITNAVVSTNIDLPVKERIGLGLKKCGFSATVHLAVELIILLAAALSSNPALSEFGIYGSLAVIMDYFLQMTFFISVLSIDIRRLELSDLNNIQLLEERVITLEQDENLMLVTIWEKMQYKFNKLKEYPFFKVFMILSTMGLVLFLFNSFHSSAFFIKKEGNHSFYLNDDLDDKIWTLLNPFNKNVYIEIQPTYKINLQWQGQLELNPHTKLSSTSIWPNLSYMNLLQLSGAMLLSIGLVYYLRYLNFKKVEIQNPTIDKPILTFNHFYSDIKMFCTDNNSDSILLYSYQNELMLWRYDSNEVILSLTIPDITCLAINSSNQFAIGSKNGEVSIRLEDEKLNKIPLPFHHLNYAITHLKFHNHFLLAINAAFELLLYDIKTSSFIYQLNAKYQVNCMTMVKEYVYLGCVDGKVLSLSLKEPFTINEIFVPTVKAIKKIKVIQNKDEWYILTLDISNQYQVNQILDDNKSIKNIAMPEIENDKTEVIVDLDFKCMNENIILYKAGVYNIEIVNFHPKHSFKRKKYDSLGCNYVCFNENDILLSLNYDCDMERWQVVSLGDKDNLTEEINVDLNKIYNGNKSNKGILKSFPPLPCNEIILPIQSIDQAGVMAVAIANYLCLIPMDIN